MINKQYTYAHDNYSTPKTIFYQGHHHHHQGKQRKQTHIKTNIEATAKQKA